MQDRARHERLSRRTRDRAAVMLILGVLLVMPPFVGILASDARIGSVPVTLLALFGLWAALIVMAWRLSRVLGAAPDDQETKQ
ncbi:MAG: hypothetical protein AAGF44_03030 [Pseudomonadota bacterium]